MSAQSQLGPEPARPAVDPQRRGGAPEDARSFARHFLAVQVTFLVFALIASIPEASSEYAPVSASVQELAIAVVWLVTDLALVAVRAVRVVAARTRR